MKKYQLECPQCGQPLTICINDDGSISVIHTDADNTVNLAEAREIGYEFGIQ